MEKGLCLQSGYLCGILIQGSQISHKMVNYGFIAQLEGWTKCLVLRGIK